MDGFPGAFGILDAEARAVVIPKIELVKMAVQMSFADMVECTDHTPLENFTYQAGSWTERLKRIAEIFCVSAQSAARARGSILPKPCDEVRRSR
jgi:hypothetical protein